MTHFPSSINHIVFNSPPTIVLFCSGISSPKNEPNRFDEYITNKRAQSFKADFLPPTHRDPGRHCLHMKNIPFADVRIWQIIFALSLLDNLQTHPNPDI